MKVRKLLPKDIPSIIEIFTFHNTAEGWNEAIDHFTNEITTMFSDSYFIRPVFIVCENNEGKIIGFAGYSNTGFDDGVFGLFWVMVHPEYQYQGVGKLLTEERIREIKEIGGGVIFSTTRKTWHLERFGFKSIAPRGDDYFLMVLIIK